MFSSKSVLNLSFLLSNEELPDSAIWTHAHVMQFEAAMIHRIIEDSKLKKGKINGVSFLGGDSECDSSFGSFDVHFV